MIFVIKTIKETLQALLTQQRTTDAAQEKPKPLVAIMANSPSGNSPFR
jgi:hypothetical protein